MSWLENIFGKVKIRPIRNEFENMLLKRLERYKSYCKYEGKTFYTDYDSKIIKIKVLGRYEYCDVDYGTVSGKVAETENGEIINFSLLTIYNRKPHDWVIYLNKYEKNKYSLSQKYNTDEDLVTKFFNNLPKDIIREIKINSIISN